MENKPEKELNLRVEELAEPLRLDVFLSQSSHKFSRSTAQKLIKSGLVLVNKELGKNSSQVKNGDQVSIDLRSGMPAHKVPSNLIAYPINLDIYYEDEDLIVVNKAAGIAVHPGNNTQHPTLVEGILAHTQLSAQGEDELRPGVVHRLDADTTGLIVFAKNLVTHAGLAKQFYDKSNLRVYTALLNGVPKFTDEELTTYYRRHPLKRQTFQALSKLQVQQEKLNTEVLKIASSHFRILKTFFDRLSLAEITLKTGRTHQIRVHAKFLGFPVFGDPIYGRNFPMPSTFLPHIKKSLAAVNRQLLHAGQLGFVHPKQQRWMQFEALPPDDFSSIIRALERFIENAL